MSEMESNEPPMHGDFESTVTADDVGGGPAANNASDSFASPYDSSVRRYGGTRYSWSYSSSSSVTPEDYDQLHVIESEPHHSPELSPTRDNEECDEALFPRTSIPAAAPTERGRPRQDETISGAETEERTHERCVYIPASGDAATSTSKLQDEEAAKLETEEMQPSDEETVPSSQLAPEPDTMQPSDEEVSSAGGTFMFDRVQDSSPNGVIRDTNAVEPFDETAAALGPNDDESSPQLESESEHSSTIYSLPVPATALLSEDSRTMADSLRAESNEPEAHSEETLPDIGQENPPSSEEPVNPSEGRGPPMQEAEADRSFFQLHAASVAAATAATAVTTGNPTSFSEDSTLRPPPYDPSHARGVVVEVLPLENHGIEEERVAAEGETTYVDSHLSHPGGSAFKGATGTTATVPHGDDDRVSEKTADTDDSQQYVPLNRIMSGKRIMLLLLLGVAVLVGTALGIFFGVRGTSRDANNGSEETSSTGLNGTEITVSPSAPESPAPTDRLPVAPSASPSPKPTDAVFATEILDDGFVSVCLKDPAEGKSTSQLVEFEYAMLTQPQSDSESIANDVEEQLHFDLAWQYLSCTFARKYRTGALDFVAMSSIPPDVLSETPCPSGLLDGGSDCVVVVSGFTAFYLGERVPAEIIVDTFLPFLLEQTKNGGALQSAHPNITGISFLGLTNPMIPSETPSLSPIKVTQEPSLAPTPKLPSRPTPRPTSKITKEPSFPSKPPSSQTIRPSAKPSVVRPSQKPASGDTATPSEGPSTIPTSNPSEQPTAVVSPSPSTSPTPGPTPEPSKVPEPVTYVPGKLAVSGNGLLLSEGLASKIIARSTEPVLIYDGSFSDLDFHSEPSGGACFPHPDGIEYGWAYLSNIEESDGNGGVGALYFDKHGRVIDYRVLMSGTTYNSGGGSTPWGTWISGEESSDLGKGFWEVHPWELRQPALTALGNRQPSNWESFAYDVRDANDPKFFFTQDAEDGPVWRFSPNPISVTTDPENTWRMLHESGYEHEYLVLAPSGPSGGTFFWSQWQSEGRESAVDHYQFAEGIDCLDGTLVFTSKLQRELFVLDLDAQTYTVSSTETADFAGVPNDQIVHLVNKDGSRVLYVTEDGYGHTSGIHSRDSSSGNIATILKAESYSDHDETAGVSFSPDYRYMYFALENTGIVFSIYRADGYTFADPYLDG